MIKTITPITNKQNNPSPRNQLNEITITGLHETNNNNSNKGKYFFIFNVLVF